ncbi:hypothetical protein [Nevskia soli]|uniref:hypothetical protein n=1 Tax=Nevskia soli TaxID=418856 RepID=UPI0012FC6CF6|nr:hypothetical protein [Nevskia soli]
MSEDISREPGSSVAGRCMRLMLYTALAVFCLLINAPWQFIMPDSGVDPSWMLLLSRAAMNHAQWGSDVVFTYGPYLDLVTRLFAPEHVAAAAVSRLLLLVVSMLSIFTIVRRRHALYACTTLAAASVSFAYVQDTQFFLYPLLFSILHFRSGERPPPALLGCLAAIGGLAVLVKLSYGLLYLFVLLAADVDLLLQRKAPIYLACLLASFAVFYHAAGQKLISLSPYLMQSMEIIAGYGDAMARDWNLLTWLVQALFLIFASACLAGIAYHALRDVRGGARIRTALYLSTFLAFSCISYKAGFSRADLWHIPTALTGVGLALLLYLASVGERSVGLPMRRTIICLASLTVLGSAIILSPNGREEGLLNRPLQAARQAALLIENPERWSRRLNADYREALQSIRLLYPLPQLNGSVDTIPSMQAALIANGLDYRNRPVIQEYSDYTEGLIQLNQAFFGGSRAPDFLIASPGSIDNRWPASAEGSLWPILFARYGAYELRGNLLILRRREDFRPAHCDEFTVIAATLNQTIDVPPLEGAVFVRIKLDKTLPGRLLSLLFQPETVHISAELADGRTVTHRLVPEMAGQGMILSPYIDTGAGMAALASGHADLLDRRRVRKFTISAGHRSGLQHRSGIEVSFCRLDLPRSGDVSFMQSIESQLKLEDSPP